MLIPNYWAEARLQRRAGDRQLTVRRFGWSLVGQVEAEAHAAERAEEAMARIVAGAELPRREPKVPYNGAVGVPIREEILATHGTAVVTRNAYGAQCLNTPNVLFADIDFDFVPSASWVLLAVALGAVLPILLGAWMHAFWIVVVGWFSMFVLALLYRQARTRLELPARAARQRIDAFLQRHPDWSLRVYRTPAGLRLLAMHRTFEPADPAVAELFDAVRADPAYVQMCRRQQCFRARVSPKPWRIGIVEHLRPRPGVWPIAAERMAARRAWVARYEERSIEFASCRYLTSLGTGATHREADAVRAIHDALCRATTTLPIA